MKVTKTKAQDAKAYGILKPVVKTVLLLSIIGTGISFASEFYAIYNSTEGGHAYKIAVAFSSATFLEGGVRVFIFLSFYMIYEMIQEFKIWKLLVFLVAASAGYFIFNRSLNLSIEGSDTYAKQTTEKPIIIEANHTESKLLQEQARQQFYADSLQIVANVNSEFATIAQNAQVAKREASKEKKRLENDPSNTPESKWFPKQIKAQSDIIRESKSVLKNLESNRLSTLENRLNTARAELYKKMSDATSIKKNVEVATDSTNTANTNIYVATIDSRQSEFTKYIWGSMLMSVLHALLYFGMLLASGIRIEYDFTPEDELELPSLSNKFWNAIRLKWYSWKADRISFLTKDKININIDSLDVQMTDNDGNVIIKKNKGSVKKQDGKSTEPNGTNKKFSMQSVIDLYGRNVVVFLAQSIAYESINEHQLAKQYQNAAAKEIAERLGTNTDSAKALALQIVYLLTDDTDFYNLVNSFETDAVNYVNDSVKQETDRIDSSDLTEQSGSVAIQHFQKIETIERTEFDEIRNSWRRSNNSKGEKTRANHAKNYERLKAKFKRNNYQVTELTETRLSIKKLK